MKFGMPTTLEYHQEIINVMAIQNNGRKKWIISIDNELTFKPGHIDVRGKFSPYQSTR